MLILGEHHGHVPWMTIQLVLLMLSGPMTAAPLLFFGAAAHRLPVVTLGLPQYVTPILQLLWAVLVRHENLSTATWLGFALVWCALLMFIAGSLHLHRLRNPSRSNEG